MGKRIKRYLLLKLLLFNCCLNIEMTDIHRNYTQKYTPWASRMFPLGSYYNLLCVNQPRIYIKAILK